MKKVILSILFCFGVGLTMMGGPAQVSDDNNSQGNCENVTSVSLKKVGAISGPQMVHVRDGVKKELNSDCPAPMKKVRSGVPKDGSATSIGLIPTTQGIVKDPTNHPPIKDPKGGKHTNGVIPLPGGKVLVL